MKLHRGMRVRLPSVAVLKRLCQTPKDGVNPVGWDPSMGHYLSTGMARVYHSGNHSIFTVEDTHGYRWNLPITAIEAAYFQNLPSGIDIDPEAWEPDEWARLFTNMRYAPTFFEDEIHTRLETMNGLGFDDDDLAVGCALYDMVHEYRRTHT